MVTTIRAALSAAMLLGFYIYALVIVVLLGALSVFAIDRAPAALAGKVVWVTLAVPCAILVATWKVLRAGPPPPIGLLVPEERAPRLWAQVRDIAKAMGTRAPDEIRLIPDVNAAVSEDARLLGLRSGRRRLLVGVPLLQAFTVDQVRSVLAHELGHYSRQHTRLGMLTYRGMDTIEQTIDRVGPTTIAGYLLRAYRRLYLLVSLAVTRRQEVEADRAAVRVAGRAATASALNDLPALAAAWGFYLDNYVGWGLDAGVAPSNVLASFPTLLSARAEELRRMRAEGPPAEGSRWDSHPPVAQRIAMINAEPDVPVAADGRPATVLLDDFDTAVEALESVAFKLGDRTRMPLELYTAAAAQGLHQREADVLYRMAERLGAGAGGLGTVLDLVEGGRGGELRKTLVRTASQDDQEAVAEAFRAYLSAAFSAALVNAGAARWRHSWTEPVALVDGAGRPAPVDDLVALVVAGDVATVRERLRQLGVDVRATVAKEASASAVGADVLAGVVNLVVDGNRTDMLVLSNGLLLVPGVKRLQMRTAKRRLVEMATSVPPEQLAATPGNRFIPYESILHSRRTRTFPKTYELAMADGPNVTIRWGTESEEVGDGFKAWDQAMALVAKAQGEGQRS